MKYRDIIDLGFNEELTNDQVYFDEYGFQYAIITMKLTKRTYLQWDKETQECSVYKIDKEHNILDSKKLTDFEIEFLIDFFAK